MPEKNEKQLYGVCGVGGWKDRTITSLYLYYFVQPTCSCVYFLYIVYIIWSSVGPHSKRSMDRFSVTEHSKYKI